VSLYHRLREQFLVVSAKLYLAEQLNTAFVISRPTILAIKKLLQYNLAADAGWSSLAARRAHNPKVVGSNPAPATKINFEDGPLWPIFVCGARMTREIPKEIPFKMIVEAISNEKGVSEDLVFEALEAALASATVLSIKKKYGKEIDVRVDIDRAHGNYEVYRRWTVVEDPLPHSPMESPFTQISLSTARYENPEIALGAVIEQRLAEAEETQKVSAKKKTSKKVAAKKQEDAAQQDSKVLTGEFAQDEGEEIKLGRIEVQLAKQVIMQKVREAERSIIAEQYKRKVGEILTGVVKKTTRDSIILEFSNNAEGLLKREHMLSKEIFRPGDRVKAYLMEVQNELKGPQLLMSRTANGMLLALFKIEVPEIADGIIEVRAVAREPGVRAKIAVKTNDGRMDPVGACVGMRGARVQAVSNELGGERIDIVLWDDNPAQLAMNALNPVEVASIVLDEEEHSMDIAVKDDFLSQAIGKGGQNIRLVSQLTGWHVRVMGDKEAQEKTQLEEQRVLDVFIQALNVDEEVAQVLVSEGFTTLEEIAYVPVEEMLAIDGFDEEIVEMLRTRAKDALVANALNSDLRAIDTVSVSEVPGVTEDLLQQLQAKHITYREQLAELGVDDLLEIAPQLSEAVASEIIMAARAHWFVPQA
jgi:N utilization substance protein A